MGDAAAAVTGNIVTSESVTLVSDRSTAFNRLNLGIDFVPGSTPDMVNTVLRISPDDLATSAPHVDNTELCRTEAELSFCGWTVEVSHDCSIILVGGMLMTGKVDGDR